jgi:uncharacterized phage-associated protein
MKVQMRSAWVTGDIVTDVAPTGERPPSAHDAVAEIRRRLPDVDALKLQKLLYYVQAWHLAWYGGPLFREMIEAWKEGPTVRVVWETYQDFGHHAITETRGGDPAKLSEAREGVVLAVLRAYGDLSANALRERTHEEAPWQEAWARRQRPSWGNREIPRERLREFFRRDAEMPGEGEGKLIPPELMNRIRAGDRDAVMEAFDRASRSG